MNPDLSPLISIIIAVYNGRHILQQCIDSVVQQTYANKELIIVDGGSRDGTVELLKTNDKYLNYWISELDYGIYNAWNKALLQAKGEWICFLGADDYFWDAQVLARMAEQLIKLPSEVCVAYGKVMLVNFAGETIYSENKPWKLIKERFKQVMCIRHQGVMHRRNLFQQYGIFDESFRIAGDYELLLRNLKTKDAYFIPDIIVVAMRQGGVSSDPANTLATMQELRRAQQIHNLERPGLIWTMAMVRVYIRLLLWKLLGERNTRKVLDLGRSILGKSPYWTKT